MFQYISFELDCISCAQKSSLLKNYMKNFFHAFARAGIEIDIACHQVQVHWLVWKGEKRQKTHIYTALIDGTVSSAMAITTMHVHLKFAYMYHFCCPGKRKEEQKKINNKKKKTTTRVQKTQVNKLQKYEQKTSKNAAERERIGNYVV